MGGWARTLALSAVAFAAVISNSAFAQSPVLQAPPRTITDITAILDQEKPDSERFARLKAGANAEPPTNTDRRALARFYQQRAEDRSALGRMREAVPDIQRAIAIGREEHMRAALPGFYSQLALFENWSGNLDQSLAAGRAGWELIAAEETRPIIFQTRRLMGINLIGLAHLGEAEQAMKQNEQLLAELLGSKPKWAAGQAGAMARAHVRFGNAAVAEAQGRFGDAAADYREAEHWYREGLARIAPDTSAVTRYSLEQACEWMVARRARALARQGQLAEAEAEVRRAVTNWLRKGGKYNLNTARILGVFTLILIEQGRYDEAEPLARTVIEIYDALGTEQDSLVYAGSVNRLAGIHALRGDWRNAAAAYDRLDVAVKGWSAARKEDELFDSTRIFTLYRIGRLDDGIAMATALAGRKRELLGEMHLETALARGMLAMGLAHKGMTAEARNAFESAAPVLLASLRDDKYDEDDAVSASAREQRVQSVIEAYIELLAPAGASEAGRTFELAEGIRGRSVQKALAASAARASARNPELAELARREQDLAKEVNAQIGLLNNALAQPPERRDSRAIEALRTRLEGLRSERAAARAKISRRFADYAALTDPQPPALAEVQSVLEPGEAFLSLYLGHDKSFVWAVRRDGVASFAAVDLGAGQIAAMVAELRKALEPNASTLDDIPPFDVALAHRLYAALLQPVEGTWKPARTLLVAANGALGLLPLGLLPVEPAKVDTAAPLFAGYRTVPWLARSHAVAMVPSAAALLTLRRLPAASASRERLIAFGDPLFSTEQALEADSKALAASDTRVAMRGGQSLVRRSAPKLEGLQHATLASLPRLPDTADELRSVARALAVDPAKALHLGKEANEQVIRQADLSHYRVVMFATHGLVAGELDGLEQPALALTAPDVAGIDGNGLLTMDKILALKLDADWVVLSACNTGTGAGAGAEAASGLGRAFFYAGTRAVLVTNWSVHSQSARDLVADLFTRQRGDATLSRSEALRRAMMELLDGKGFTDDSGQTLFTYGHPLFWAPYTIIGDGR
jgi:CHAT domain-containing protein